MRRSLALVAGLLLFGLLIQACNYKENKISGGNEPTSNPHGPGGHGEPGQPTPSPQPPQEWFTAIQTTILKPKCVSCHKPGNAQKDVDVTTYKAVMESDPPLIVKGKPKSSRFYKCLVEANPDKRMPLKEAPLTDTEIQTIYNWIQKGAPQNAATDSLEEDYEGEEELEFR